MVSFNVENLFPNVPVDIIYLDMITELLKNTYKTIYFQFQNDFCHQNFWMAMVPSLSPILNR